MTTEGIIKSLFVGEEGEWLSFKVNYLDQAQHRIVTNHEVLRCKIPDRAIRTFLQSEINCKGASNRGRRLFDKILMVKIPMFHKASVADKQLIRNQLEPYLKDLDAHQAWESEFKELDDGLNRKIYHVYGLSQEEAKYVEDNSRPTGWLVD